MPLFWFLTGILATLAVLTMVCVWRGAVSRLSILPLTPLRAAAVAAVLVAMIPGLYEVLKPATRRETSTTASAGAAAKDGTAAAFGAAAKMFDSAGESKPAGTAPPPSAGSMDAAVANLEARLAKGGGSAGDWELLAKSFEFLGRPGDAAKARAQQLPDASQSPKNSQPNSVVVTGEISVAQALGAKAAPGDTLFIVAKSIDSPGVPVAVLRSSVASWPLKFKLDDSLSMLPGRNLSSSGHVTIEARISKSGQPLPQAGDLQGSSGPLDPAEHKLLKIMIDHEIS